MTTPWQAAATEPVRTEDDFVAFLDRVGLCTWKPLPPTYGTFPNMAEVMTARSGDVMGETWFWKDDLHIARRLFYGKWLAGNTTFASMDMLPALIAARGDVDPHTLHERGRLTDASLRVYEAITRCRELSTSDLRREAGLNATDDRRLFDQATVQLACLFQICKTGIRGRTRGTYAYIWGLVEDFLPDVLRKAAAIRPHEGARAVAARLQSGGVRMAPAQWRRLFGWDEETLAETVGAKAAKPDRAGRSSDRG